MKYGSRLPAPAGATVVLACVLGAGTGMAAEQSAEPPQSFRLSATQARVAGVKLDTARSASAMPAGLRTSSGVRLAGQVAMPGDTSGIILSAVSGQLESVLVQIGSEARAGQPLARIYSAELAGMQRDYLQARAASQVAAGHLARDESLFNDGIISESRLRETRAARQIALATEQEQRRLMSLAGYADAEIAALSPGKISSTVTIHAPADAVVLAQSAAVGQPVEPGTELFRLASSGRRWLELHASVRQASAIRVGDLVSIVGCEGTGRVIAVGTQLDPSSQTLSVRAELVDTTSCVRPNQYVETDVHPASMPAGLVSVPASALVRNGQQDYVFVAKGEAFHPVPVTVARRQGDEAWLRGGVSAGTRVASSGITALKGAWLGLGPQLEGGKAK